jgi:hypothetical protein
LEGLLTERIEFWLEVVQPGNTKGAGMFRQRLSFAKYCDFTA